MLEADVDPAGQAVEGEGEAEMESRDLNAEVIRLTLELQEATEEKLQAARYGLVVLEESAALKMKHRQLEEEYEALKAELQQLKEVGMPQSFTLQNSRSTITEYRPCMIIQLKRCCCLLFCSTTRSLFIRKWITHY